jgi:hypothetical protein
MVLLFPVHPKKEAISQQESPDAWVSGQVWSDISRSDMSVTKTYALCALFAVTGVTALQSLGLGIKHERSHL